MSIITTRGIDEDGKPVYYIEIEAPYTSEELKLYISTVHDMFPYDFKHAGILTLIDKENLAAFRKEEEDEEGVGKLAHQS